jgi:hypothetical protein
MGKKATISLSEPKNSRVEYNTSLAYNIYTLLCTVILIDMKINFDLKNKYPSVEFCYNNKSVIITYWGGIKFTKRVIYGA